MLQIDRLGGPSQQRPVVVGQIPFPRLPVKVIGTARRQVRGIPAPTLVNLFDKFLLRGAGLRGQGFLGSFLVCRQANSLVSCLRAILSAFLALAL